jgi:hypothetical protein
MVLSQKEDRVDTKTLLGCKKFLPGEPYHYAMRGLTASLTITIAIAAVPAVAQPLVTLAKVLERPDPPFPLAAKAASGAGPRISRQHHRSRTGGEQ